MARNTKDNGESVTHRSVGYTSPGDISEHPDMIRLKELVKKLDPERREQLIEDLVDAAEYEGSDERKDFYPPRDTTGEPQ